MKKEVLVETVDKELFQVLMSYVVKNDNGEYKIFLKDLCTALSLNINDVNKFLKLDYSTLRGQNIFHYELPMVSQPEACKYIESGKEYEYSDQDIFYISSRGGVKALPFLLLNLKRNPAFNVKYNEVFAVVVSMTVEDCFIYAPNFECDGE